VVSQNLFEVADKPLLSRRASKDRFQVSRRARVGNRPHRARRRLQRKSESIVAWSPEGDEILVVADDPPANIYDSEICLIDVDGSGRRCLVDLAEEEIVSGGERFRGMG
jgi:hypothetical protein